jgi:hypothetical protein
MARSTRRVRPPPPLRFAVSALELMATANDMERWAPIVFEDQFTYKGCGGKCYCCPCVFCVPLPLGCCLAVSSLPSPLSAGCSELRE